jgi:cell division septum initiation protein DivIVA
VSEADAVDETGGALEAVRRLEHGLEGSVAARNEAGALIEAARVEADRLIATARVRAAKMVEERQASVLAAADRDVSAITAEARSLEQELRSHADAVRPAEADSAMALILPPPAEGER